MRERIYFVGIRKDLVPDGFTFEFPKAQPESQVHEYLIDAQEVDFIDKKQSFETFLRYLDNKYNTNQYTIASLLSEEYLVLDTRQSDLRLYRNRVPTLRTGRHGILYVKNGKFRKLSGFESLLLQGFPRELAGEVVGVIDENKLLKQTGNAMTVNVIEAISKELFKSLKEYA
jgi:DNA (cytosine-5)-methyltransferase 1